MLRYRVLDHFELKKHFEEIWMQTERVSFRMICFSFNKTQTCKRHLENTVISQTYGTEGVCVHLNEKHAHENSTS